jgi:hypothetical protein
LAKLPVFLDCLNHCGCKKNAGSDLVWRFGNNRVYSHWSPWRHGFTPNSYADKIDLPLRLLRESNRRPALVDILWRKPWSFFLLWLFG